MEGDDPLPETLLIAVCGTLAGGDDFAQIGRWARREIDFLCRLRPFENGVPSHETLRDVMSALPADLFSACFAAWVAGLAGSDPDMVAIDGKSSRRAHGAMHRPLHTVSARPSRKRLVPGRQAVETKSNVR